MDIEVKWQGGYKFSGKTMYGREISTDASKKAGGNEDGYQPMELLIYGLAGCTGIDVIMIAEKMRLDITDLIIKIKADQREENPRAFKRANIEYIFTGNNLKKDKLEKIIIMSEEKYCSAAATLSSIVKITHSCTIIGE